MINAFKYTKQLEEAGFSREQAETQLQVITEIVEADVATKKDLSTAVETINFQLEKADQARHQVAERLEHKINQMEYRITIKLGTLVTIAVGVVTALIKIL